MKHRYSLQVVLFVIALALSLNILLVLLGINLDVIRYPLKPFINFDGISCVVQSICN